MLNGRKSLVTVIAGAALVATVGIIPADSAQAKPTIEDVQHRVDRLYHAAEQASERYNQIHVQLKQMHGDVNALRADQARQQHRTEKARRQVVADSIVRQYEGDSLSAVGQAVVTSDPSRLRLAAEHHVGVQLHAGQPVLLLPHPGQGADHPSGRHPQPAGQGGARSRRQAAADKATIAQQPRPGQGRARQDAGRRARPPARGVARWHDPGHMSDIPASGRAAVAVHFAMAQVGKPYVYGAAGPNAYDCSGLTMAAWGAAGVGLSHSSSAQYGEGTHISPSQLQPGDLVFYYSPISHVGMYIGNGMIVNAENPSAGIRVAPLYSMPFVGAVRPG